MQRERPCRYLGGIGARRVLSFIIGPIGAISKDRNGSDLGGIRIWAGSVPESETIPAQIPIWNESRPDERGLAASEDG